MIDVFFFYHLSNLAAPKLYPLKLIGHKSLNLNILPLPPLPLPNISSASLLTQKASPKGEPKGSKLTHLNLNLHPLDLWVYK